MTIDQATREDIVRYKAQGKRNREIAELTGASDRTISRVLAEHAKNGGDTPKSALPTRTHATKGTRQNPPKSSAKIADTPKSPEVTIMPSESIRVMTQNMTKDEMMELLESAKGTLSTAKAQNDGTPQAMSAEIQATKAVREIISEMGKWCGMDKSITDTGSKVRYTREDIETMDRETMHRIVLEWSASSR